MQKNQTQQKKKNRKIFSKTLRAQIKRKPHTQLINGLQYTYGLLQKKSESSFFNNQRFIIIKGYETFGYASKLPDQTLLPFLDIKNIPKCKIQIPLDKLEINNEKQVLIVKFQEQTKKQMTKWQFTCKSKVKAIEWRQKIEGAKNQRILSLKNKAVKVILEDLNQRIQTESDRNLQKKRKMLVETRNEADIQNQPNEGLKISKENNKLRKQQPKSDIIVREEDGNEQKNQPQFNQQKENIIVQNQERRTLNQPETLEANLFQSLLLTSTEKEIDVQSRNNWELPREKSIEHPQLVSKIDQESSILERNETVNRAKQQFLKRKKEQQEIKQQLRQENKTPSFFNSVLKTISENKYQIEKLKKQWGYEFAKGLNEFEIIQNFKIYVQLIAIKIVDELSLQERKRYYQPVSQTSQSIKYEIEGVSLQFFLHELKELASFDKNGSIVSSQASKRARQQFKNYDYILQLTNNKGRIRVPLSMCVQYKGFFCLAKVMVLEASNYSNIQSLQKQLDLLQAESRISNSIFEEEQNGRIVPLMNREYQRLARADIHYTGSSNNFKKFDICYVQGLKHYLPQDFYKYNLQQQKSIQSLNPTHILRRQLVQDEEYDNNIFYGQNMSATIHRLKMPQHLKEAIETLKQVSDSIPDRINALATALQNLDEFITNSKDLSKLMHGYGLNIRYLGLLFERSHQAWLKCIISSEIIARCAKFFLQFDLQDCITNLNQTKIENVRRYEVKLVIAFFNKILGNSEESDLLWNQLSRQAQQNFGCYVSKKEINTGYFLQALQFQCRVQLVNILDRKNDLFKVPEPLSIQNFCVFGLNSKTYDLSFTQLYTTVNQHLKEVSQQSYQQLSILLNLQRKGSLASHFKICDYDQRIILFLINWLSPTEGHQIYYPQQIHLGEIMPTKALYEIKLTEIKWLLKDKKQSQAEKVRDFVIEHVNKWLGQYHPVLSELYDILSRYYSASKWQEKKATAYCKSSIKNIQKLLGQSNIKLADNYFMLAEIYINYQKKTEALNSLKRAKEILDERDGEDTEAYGIIELRMAQLLLATNKVNEALAQGTKAYSKLMEGDDFQKIVDSIELIGRCYELADMFIQYAKFSDELITSNVSSKLEYFSESPSLLQRVLKVLILPSLASIAQNVQTSKQLFLALSSFPSLSNVSTSSQTNSYNYLKSLILQGDKVFPRDFVSILETDLQELLEEVESSGIMTRWKGFENLIQNKSLIQKINSISTINAKAYEFLLILEALTIFLGEGWIESVIRGQ